MTYIHEFKLNVTLWVKFYQQRHRMVNETLKEELATGVHALSIQVIRLSIINWIDSFLCQHENIWYSMNSNNRNSNKLFAQIEHHMGVVVQEVWVH